MADFEQASAKAFGIVFGDSVVISGCWFHYCQAVGNFAKKKGLTDAYKQIEPVRKCIRMLMSLPLLPADSITEGLNDIIAQCIPSIDAVNKQAVMIVVEYVKKQWINKADIGTQRMSVVGNRERTNNGVESFHSALRKRVKVSHPNLFTFYEAHPRRQHRRQSGN